MTMPSRQSSPRRLEFGLVRHRPNRTRSINASLCSPGRPGGRAPSSFARPNRQGPIRYISISHRYRIFFVHYQTHALPSCLTCLTKYQAFTIGFRYPNAI